MFDNLIKQVCNANLGELTRTLTSKAGFSASEAKGFLPVVIEKLTAAVTGGNFDLKSLDPQKLLGMLNVGELAKSTGIDSAKTTSGLQAILPQITRLLQAKAGDATGMLDAGKGLLGKMGLGS